MTTNQQQKPNGQQQLAKAKSKLKTISKPTVKSSLLTYELNVVDIDKEKEILNLLQEALRMTFPSQAKINWKEIHKEKLPKKLKKEKIRKLKSDLKDKEITEKNIDIKNQRFFCLGFNKVVKGLQSKEVACLLLSRTFPEELKNVLTHLTVTMDVPILGLSGLEATVKTTLGFNCSVIGFTKDIDTSSDFKQLTVKVLESSSKLKGEKVKKESVLNSNSGQDSTLKKIEPVKQNPIRNLHLKRKDSHSRTFTPSISKCDEEAAPRRKFKSCNMLSSTSYLPTVM